MTSRIVSRPASTIASRSIPSPRPPVGGMPYDERLDEVRVALLGLDVAARALLACIAKRSACSSASLSSEKALPSSMPPTKYSNRSVMVGSSSVGRANGDSSTG